MFKAGGIVFLAAAALMGARGEEPSWMQVSEKDAAPRSHGVGHEANTSVSYVFGSELRQGERDYDNISEIQSSFSYTASLPTADSFKTRVGLAWDRYSFGVPDGGPVPNTLQSTALVLGFDMEIDDQWLMRFEMSPGVYSDFYDVSGDDVNVPMILGFSYLVDSRLQWVLGLSVDWKREYPVLPGVGVRWQFADEWTLNFILPQPRLEYQVDPTLKLYVGADMKGGTYTVRENFGRDSGVHEWRKLNGEDVSYTEVRVGLGVGYKIHPAVTLQAEGGGVMFRTFEYDHEDLTLRSRPTGYGAISIKAGF